MAFGGARLLVPEHLADDEKAIATGNSERDGRGLACSLGTTRHLDRCNRLDIGQFTIAAAYFTVAAPRVSLVQPRGVCGCA